MTTRPTEDTDWATDATYSSGAENGETTKADPSGLRPQGILPNQRIPARFFNFLFGALGLWRRYLAEKTDHVFSPLNFDAVGDAGYEDPGTDDTSEIQDCFDAAYAQVLATAGGNVTVDLGGRAYRVTGALNCYPHVMVKNGALVMDHGTANLLVFNTDATLRTDTIWENVDLRYIAGNTGDVISLDQQLRVVFRNCHVNASGFNTGKIFNSEVEDTRCELDHCIVKSGRLGTAIYSDFAEVCIRFGQYTMAPGATGDLIYGDKLTVEDAEFFQVSTAGNIAFIALAGSSIFRNQIHRNYFEVDDDAAGFSTYAVKLATNKKLQMTGNEFAGDTLPYKVASVPIAADSEIQLLPHIAVTTDDATATVPWYYRDAIVISDHTDPPVVDIGAPAYRGQEAIRAVRNISGGGWTGAIGFTSSAPIAYSEADLADLGDDEIASIHFEAIELDSGLSWVQIGAAAQHFLAS